MLLEPDPAGSLPLTETTFLILVCLAPGPGHGYAIMKEVQALSRDRIQLSTGTLYGALKRLLARGWIERVDEAPETATPLHRPTPEPRRPGRPRKVYALTDLGRRVLEAELARLQDLLAAARLRTAEAEQPVVRCTRRVRCT
jgi:DNA-binding PadR family transcriptional regulator